MLRQDFEGHIATLPAGRALIYHIGNMMWDRERGTGFQRVNSTAHAAWEAMEAGKVYLVQRRVLPDVFEYVAIKRDPPYSAVEWTGCYDPHRTEACPKKVKVT